MSNTEQVQVRHKTVMDDDTRHASRIYAEALYRAAESNNQVEEVLGELDSLVYEAFRQNPGLELFLSSAAVSADRKEAAIKAAFENRATPTFSHFLLVLNKHERLNMLSGIAEAFRMLYNRKTRRLRVQVASAVPLTDDERRRLCDDVRGVAQFEPLLEETVDPDVLGGMVVRILDWVYDASVSARLQMIQTQLIDRSSHGIQSGRDRFSS